MQDYVDIAAKKGVILSRVGNCQFCGADTERGVHECVEIFSVGFQVIDYSNPVNHSLRFVSVDAHALQHPEIHGRWNNHFHLTRQHLMFHYQIPWNYRLSTKLSDHLNEYRIRKANEYLDPPALLERGKITVSDVLKNASIEEGCRKMINKWGRDVYISWNPHHDCVDSIAQTFLKRNKIRLGDVIKTHEM